MPKEWRVYSKKADYDALSEKFHIDRLTAGLLVNRGLRSDEEIERFLWGGLSDLNDELLLPDISKAVDIIAESIGEGRSLRIVGDYDIDGVCSVYILLKGLSYAAESLGKSASIDYVIPDRIKDGYGINRHIIEKAAEDKKELIITCDNGISAIEELRLAKELSIKVIVTDHHDVRKDEAGRDILPMAEAVTDPKRADSSYPFEGICGAVVSWKLIKAVFERLSLLSGEAAGELLFGELLAFAAFATVGDVMELHDENRIIVKEGLKLINSKKGLNLGLSKLIEGCGISEKEITGYHIGFILGPCINAGGRLETAETALRLFLCDNEREAEALSEKLIELNRMRKEMTETGVNEAELIAEHEYGSDKVLVIYLPKLHESLAGIVAGRLRERYSKPVFVITEASEGLKGSGRSIEAYPMAEKLCEVSDILTKFGGHPMAAGLSLEKKDLEKLRKRLNENSGLSDSDLVERGAIDYIIPVSYISTGLIEELELLKPFGQGNERPVLADREISIYDMRVLGAEKKVLRMRLADKNGYNISGIMFGDAEENRERIKELCGKKKGLSIVYYPEINVFNGRRNLQLNILDVL